MWWFGLGFFGTLIGALVAATICWCRNWLRACKQRRLEEEQRLADEQLPWQEYVDGRLARRVAEQLVILLNKHWPRVLAWVVKNRKHFSYGSDRSKSIKLRDSPGHIMLLVDEKVITIYVGSTPIGLGNGSSTECPPINAEVVATALMEAEVHPRELVTLLAQPLLEQQLLSGLLGQAIPLSVLQPPQVLDGRELSFPEGEEVLGEVIRMRDTDQPDASDTDITTSA